MASPIEKPKRSVPPKRVKTWEETVKQKASRPETTGPTANGVSAEVTTEAPMAEEEGALPEEGELPDS